MIQIKTLSLFQGNSQNNDQVLTYKECYIRALQGIRVEKRKAQIKKLSDNTHTHSVTHTLIWINQPHLLHSLIIHNNNTMDTEFLEQMRQSNKCGSVRNDQILNWNLGSGVGPWVSISCLLQDTTRIYWFHLPKQLTRKKEINQKRDSTLNKSYHTALVYVNRIQG